MPMPTRFGHEFSGEVAAVVTRKWALMLAHRPGFVVLTLAGRKLATLDHFSGGRLAVHSNTVP